MPARIVVVLNEQEIAEEATSALRAQGQDAVALVDPMTALEALEGAERIEVLVTCLDFAPGKPNGVALGRMARLKRPGIRVLFIGPADLEELAEGLGTFMPSPVTGPQVVERVLQTLDTASDIRWTPLRTSPRDQAQNVAITGNETSVGRRLIAPPHGHSIARRSDLLSRTGQDVA